MKVNSLLSPWVLLRLFIISAGCTLQAVAVEQPNTQVLAASENSFWAQRFNATNNIAYGDLARQKLDIYRQGQWQGPPKYFVTDTQAKPTLIYIHGGAWHGGVKESALWSLMHYLQKGWNVVNVEYRVGGGTAPQAADDVLLALQWLAQHADEYAIDRHNIVVSGDSAGGHLALLAGLVNKQPKHEQYVGDKLNVKAIVNWFGIADIAKLSDYFVARNGWNYPKLWAGNEVMFTKLVAHYSPINYVSKNSPAVISIHGDADQVVPIEQSIALHEKLTKAGVANKLVTLAKGRHLGFSDQQFQIIYGEIFKFVVPLVNK
ncbi:MAG: alpha/beta hydrolase fold domain-containing protein [Thalassotalea sp.]